jgi:hypothetical protein
MWSGSSASLLCLQHTAASAKARDEDFKRFTTNNNTDNISGSDGGSGSGGSDGGRGGGSGGSSGGGGEKEEEADFMASFLGEEEDEGAGANDDGDEANCPPPRAVTATSLEEAVVLLALFDPFTGLLIKKQQEAEAAKEEEKEEEAVSPQTSGLSLHAVMDQALHLGLDLLAVPVVPLGGGDGSVVQPKPTSPCQHQPKPTFLTTTSHNDDDDDDDDDGSIGGDASTYCRGADDSGNCGKSTTTTMVEAAVEAAVLHLKQVSILGGGAPVFQSKDPDILIIMNLCRNCLLPIVAAVLPPLNVVLGQCRFGEELTLLYPTDTFDFNSTTFTQETGRSVRALVSGDCGGKGAVAGAALSGGENMLGLVWESPLKNASREELRCRLDALLLPPSPQYVHVDSEQKENELLIEQHSSAPSRLVGRVSTREPSRRASSKRRPARNTIDESSWALPSLGTPLGFRPSSF